jgi:hypothetical protein
MRLRSCVRPVCAAESRWPRWVPPSSTKHSRGVVSAIESGGFSCSSDRPITISSLSALSAPSAPTNGSGCDGSLGHPPRLAIRHHGPRRAGHLVGQSHRRELARSAFQQLQQPRRGGLAAWPCLADHRHGTHHEQLSEPLVACSADAAQPLFAAGGSLLRCQTQPTRQSLQRRGGCLPL